MNATTGGTAPPAAVPIPPPAGTGRYVLGDMIARGGMGVVYRATDTTLGREVAVKVLGDKFEPGSSAARRFADEARITGQLQHPAIPPVYDLGTLPGGRPFLALKLIKGNTFDALLEARPDAGDDRGRFVAVFEQVCQALAFAHAHGVIHRDLKPANVMVGNYGEVQVMDWGLAKVLGAGTSSAGAPAGETRAETEIQSLRDAHGEFTQAGSILGTPAFMPPEQAIGAIDEVDARSDVFGLGGILCVILTGRAPFAADTAERTRQAAARGKAAEAFARLDICGADPELIALCKRCLATEKVDRPADGEEVARKVAALRAKADERARRAELDRVRLEGERAAAQARAAERRKRQRLLVAAAVVLAAAVVGGLSAVLLVQRQANADLTRQQAKVEARFELAQKAIAKLHTGVSEDMLLKSDQFKELRTQLLKEAAGFYGDLEQLLEGEPDAKSRRLLANGYFQLGQLTAQIGSMSEALATHRKGLAMRRELAAAAGADVEGRLDLARSLAAIGGSLSFMGDANGALASFAEQNAVARALDDEHPSMGVQIMLAQSLVNIGFALQQLGKADEALAANAKAVVIQRKLVEADPGAAELQYDLAGTLLSRGYLLWDVGQWAQEQAAEENARIIMEKLTKDNPTVTRFQFRLGRVYNNIGSSFFDEGKPAEAVPMAEKARDIMQKLVQAQPAAAQFQFMLARHHLNIGQAQSELGKPAEATASLERVLDLCAKLAEANTPPAFLVVLWAGTETVMGDIHAQQGKTGEALQFYDKARTRLRKQAQAHPGSDPDVGIALARSLEKIGLLLSALGKNVEALAACQEALNVRDNLSKARPFHAFARGELTESFAVLARVQRRAGRSTEAVASLRRAIALVQQLPAPTVRNLYNLACYHALLADTASETGSGMTADERAAGAERASATLRQAVAAGYTNVAQLRADVCLEVLRPREEFQKLLRVLEVKSTAADRSKDGPRAGPANK